MAIPSITVAEGFGISSGVVDSLIQLIRAKRLMYWLFFSALQELLEPMELAQEDG